MTLPKFKRYIAALGLELPRECFARSSSCPLQCDFPGLRRRMRGDDAPVHWRHDRRWHLALVRQVEAGLQDEDGEEEEEAAEEEEGGGRREEGGGGAIIVLNRR